MRTRRLVGAAGLLAALLPLAGCGGDSQVGEVTGTVTVDGQTPPPGSSITFVPTDGKSPTAGPFMEKIKGLKSSAKSFPVLLSAHIRYSGMRWPMVLSPLEPTVRRLGRLSDS